MPTKILSIDGGGIRGVIPATVLDHVEKTVGRPIAELFDVIAGTSTGGLIALGLTCPGDAGARIFPRELFGRIRQFFEEKYPDDGLNEVLEERLGDARLADALTSVIVTAYDIEARKPVFMRSAKDDLLMRDVARATAAAPTYFEPEGPLIDGGVFATNPGMCAFVDAYAGQANVDDTLLVSLGTGSLTKPIKAEDARSWGLAGWARHILDVVFDGVSDTVDYQLGQILGSRYYRLQTPLTLANDDMDDASAENISNLERQGQALIDAERATLDEICAALA
jgi:patatin-like phospholipase/acyl hydrolase